MKDLAKRKDQKVMYISHGRSRRKKRREAWLKDRETYKEPEVEVEPGNIPNSKWTNRKRAYHMWHNSKWRAIHQNQDFDLTQKWIREKLDAGICEATGLPFEYPETMETQSNPWAPSIDKVFPRFGYVQTNCRMVVWTFNRAKGIDTDQVLLKLARAIVLHKDKLRL